MKDQLPTIGICSHLVYLFIHSIQDIMQNFDLFFESSVSPLSHQMESFHVHEATDFAIGFFIKDDVLHHVLFIEWMLEQLVLEFCEEK